LNGTHQLLAYADDVNLLGNNAGGINKITETLIDASKEVGLEINIRKTKYMFLCCHQNAGQIWNINVSDRSFENMSQFKYLGTTVTNHQVEIKRRLNSGSACYHLVQNILFSCLLLENVKIRICKTVILPVVLYWCEILSLSLREEHRLRVFENRVLRRIFEPKKDEVTGGWRNCITRSFVICTLCQV
jgi:hypothetical protein